MTSVKVRDKRYASGFYSKIFYCDCLEQKVYDFVKKQKNAYLICGIDRVYRREEFLKKYEIRR